MTNYTHLFSFLKCYPFVKQLIMNFSKVDANRVLDLMYSLQPSLNEVTILEEYPSDVLKIDLSFIMRLFNLSLLHFESTRLPIKFLREVAAKRGPHLNGLFFNEITARHAMLIHFSASGVFLMDSVCEFRTPEFSSVDQLIDFMQMERHFSTFLM